MGSAQHSAQYLGSAGSTLGRGRPDSPPAVQAQFNALQCKHNSLNCSALYYSMQYATIQFAAMSYNVHFHLNTALDWTVAVCSETYIEL